MPTTKFNRNYNNTLKSNFIFYGKGGIFKQTTKTDQVSFKTIYVTDNNLLNKYREELMKYDKLRQIIVSALQIHLNNWKEGNYSELESGFTFDESIRLGRILNENTLVTFSTEDIEAFINSDTMFTAYQITQPGFTTYKSFMHLVVDGINSAITLNTTNTALLASINSLRDYQDILENPTRLNEYIEENYATASFPAIIETEGTQTSALRLPEEIEIYFKIYGVPTGDFDNEKLSDIYNNIQRYRDQLNLNTHVLI
tara:strand:+ start:2348 stop:3115 length:768 start_codon:yes stop_codon:yes gene_type:complete